jgi:putative phosphoesterase
VLLAIVSDTHMPRGGRALPTACVERLRGADLIVHAGDFVDLAVLREIEAYGPVAAVHGNVDASEVRGLLPKTRVVEAGGARIAMVHDGGPSAGRLDRMRDRFPNTDAVVFGHSHLPLHERGDDGFQIFNPGSPTERRRAPAHTMGMARVDERGAVEFELIELH